jgi:two-component system, cell cycle response regulator
VTTSAATCILLLEDNPGDVKLFQAALEDTPELPFQIIHRASVAQALEFLSTERPDVVLCDLCLPDSQGLDTVRSIHGAAPDLPLVVLTSLNDEALASAVLNEGAQDYLVKTQVTTGLLWHTLRYAMKRHHVQRRLQSLAYLDDLTGLSNRRGFLALASHHARHAGRSGAPFLVAAIDLDGLKEINDTFGHQEGNRAIVDTADVLKVSFRQCDILARLGGDEFCVLITDAGASTMGSVIGRVRRNLEACNRMPGRCYDLSFSIGMVAAEESMDIEALLSHADRLMYEQKRTKKTSARRRVSAQRETKP